MNIRKFIFQRPYGKGKVRVYTIKNRLPMPAILEKIVISKFGPKSRHFWIQIHTSLNGQLTDKMRRHDIENCILALTLSSLEESYDLCSIIKSDNPWGFRTIYSQHSDNVFDIPLVLLLPLEKLKGTKSFECFMSTIILDALNKLGGSCINQNKNNLTRLSSVSIKRYIMDCIIFENLSTENKLLNLSN
jgi:hypothetical protein